MKVKQVLLLLVLLSGVAADLPRRAVSEADTTAILKAAGGYKPDGSVITEVTRGKTPDIAYVRYSTRRGGQYLVTAVVTLKKTPKGWQAESCAR